MQGIDKCAARWFFPVEQNGVKPGTSNLSAKIRHYAGLNLSITTEKRTRRLSNVHTEEWIYEGTLESRFDQQKI